MMSSPRTEVPFGAVHATLAGVEAKRPDPFTAPTWLWPIALSIVGLHLGYVIFQALEGGSLPFGLKLILGVVQFVWFLIVPISAGIWWGRGRPGAK